MHRIITIIIFCGLLQCIQFCFGEDAEKTPTVALDQQDRILILAPHPDDEVIACAGIIQQAIKMHLPIRIVFLTYGDNNEWSFLVYRKHPVLIPGAVRNMGLVRHDEALKADKFLGVPQEQLIFLGYPDFGTLNIWYSHWVQAQPFKSMLTKVKAVPYKNAFRPGAAYKGEEILQDIKKVLLDFKPTKIFVSHPADHNPDHLSFYLFTKVALWDLEKNIEPQVYPYLVHFKRWPKPRGYYPAKALEPPIMLKEELPWQTYDLDAKEISDKFAALKAHWTQYHSSGKYIVSFVRANELFGDFPIVKLEAHSSMSSLSPQASEKAIEIPEQLTDEERAAFIGFEERSVGLKGNELIFSIRLSRPVAKAVEISLYAFGYRTDIPFPQMPKLHVKIGALNYDVYDKNKKISKKNMKVFHRGKNITITLPLEMLGNPQKVLTSTRIYLSEVAMDWVSWRILELPH
jgi:LmbE family N-acetylglucosaminyl deacetylase